MKVESTLAIATAAPGQWRISPLGKIAEVTKLAGFEYTSYFNSYADAGDVIVIRALNISGNKLNFDDVKTIPRKVSNELVRSKLSKGDLAFTFVGSNIGPVCLIDENNKYHLGPNVARITANADLLPEFLYHCFTSNTVSAQIREYTSTGAQPSLSMQKIRLFEIPHPPLPEQRAIATALTDLDALINSLDLLIAKKQDIRQAAMQQLLSGKTRLPGYSGNWTVKKLGEIARIVNGGTPRTSIVEYWDGGINWCTPTDVTNCKGKYLSETEKKISAGGLANCSASILPVGALLLCSRATIGEIRIAGGEICTNQGFKSLICEEGVNNEFLYYMLLTMKPRMLEKASGSTFLEISKVATASLELLLPVYSEQTAIATVLSDIDIEILAFQERRDKTLLLKQGMMQELLTGRTRLV